MYPECGVMKTSGYRNKFYKGELTGKDTFSKRTLSDIPMFVQKQMSNANIENDG
jgi:hypothetical protein